jgi:ADP-L-glycero-D-manno-heptose 6-epimerase
MTVLVTGHKGFIGQNMLAALPDAVGHEWHEWCDGEPDLTGIERVIHLGAISSTACRDWDALLQQNVISTVRLVEDCDRRGIPIQIASSAAVYGPDNTTFSESDKPNPRSPYAMSKFIVEKYVLNQSFSIPIQLFRYFNVYGPHEDHKDQPSPHTRFRRQALATGKIEVFEGSEDIRRDFVPVERVVEMHKYFFDLDVSGVYNLGTGEAVSFMDVARSVALETSAEIVTVPMPHIPGYQRFTQANMCRTNSLLQTRKA